MESELTQSFGDNLTKLQDMWSDMVVKAAHNRAAAVETKQNAEAREEQFQTKRKITDTIGAGMSDTERENILRNKGYFYAAEYSGQAETQIKNLSEKLNSGKLSLIKEALKTAAVELNLPSSVFNDDMNMDVQVSIGTLKESASKQISNVEQLVRIIPVLRESVKNAVGIEVHNNRYYADTDTVYFANLLGGYTDGDNFVPVRFGIKASKGGRNTLYVLISDQKIKTEVVKSPLPDNPGSIDSRSAFPISITSLSKLVNSKDIIKYLPDGLLTEEQRKAKWDAIADTIKSTSAKNDQKYYEAVKRGDMRAVKAMVIAAAETAMPDSAIRGDNGKLLGLYHGTEDDFTVFDTSVKGGEHGTAEGFGIYLSPDQRVTEHYGERQIKLFANIKRPARSDQKTIRLNELANLIKNTCEIEAQSLVEEGYDSVTDAIKDTWISNYVNTYDASSMSAAYMEAAQKILEMNDSDMSVVQEVMAGMAIRDYEDAIAFYKQSLMPTTGIDGFVTEWSDSETGEGVPIILAIESRQLKSTDPITYDNDGNIIPLSERFRTDRIGEDAWKNEDIRYSRKSSESYAVRDIVDRALKRLDTNSAEYKAMAKYKSELDVLDGMREQLDTAIAGRMRKG